MEAGDMKTIRDALDAALVLLEERQKLALCRNGFVQIKTKYCDLKDAIEKCRSALAKPPRNCDKLSAEECKRIFAKEMTIYLPPEATDNDRTIATLTANGVIDALYATAQAGGYDESR